MLRNALRKMSATSCLVVFLLSACGPVKFSASSDDTTSVTPDANNSGGGSTGGSNGGADGSGSGNNTPPTLRDVHYNSSATATNNKLDIVLIIDDSNSMLPDNQKLAANLSGFVSKLQSSNIDWQMCATVTRALKITDTESAWGASVYWQKTSTPSSELGMVLKKGTANLSTIFTNTINYIGAGWQGSDDERAIKAAYRHVYNGDLRYQPNNGCYRPDSAVAYIIISDEDERSIGGDASQQVYSGELKELENEDKSDVFISFFKETFGSTRRFTVNSIIVKPGDSACKSSQDAGGAKSHYGTKYAELSSLTSGGIGSICESDFSTNLNLFFDKIQDSLSSVPLECAPYNGNITVNITPSIGTVQSRIEGMNLVFDTPVPAGHTIDLTYQCAESRSPSSIAQPSAELGFWARLMNFFKNLF